jgi:LuxR family maltose regulon positive regulatory protein
LYNAYVDDVLLQTKLHIPRLRPTFIQRPRLIEKLKAGLNGKLTLVSAPAGFGKTAILCDWAGNCDWPVAWLTLDSGDNDSTRFWTHVVAALDALQPGFGATAVAGLKSPQAPPIQLLLSGLINEIAEAVSSFTLVLDDYHAIGGKTIHDDLIFIINHLPQQMHLIIATRADPPLPFGSLRGQGELNELRTADLRFTPEEIEAFMNRSMGLDLSKDDIELLDKCTEGWIVGLQLAALSMRDQMDKHTFIANLAGDNRYIADYLMEEVLQRQSRNIQDFLLQTSILDALTASLCQAVTGMDNCYQLLIELEQNNLFITPLDDNREWFRYHPLFADLLRARFKRAYSEDLHLFHQRASYWFEAHELPHEAINHAFTVGDLDRTASLIESRAINLISYGEIQTVVAWLDRLPENYFNSHPRLSVAQAWISLFTGQLDAAEAQLQNAEIVLSNSSMNRHIAGQIATIRSGIAAFRSDQTHVLQYAQEGLANLPDEDYMTRGLALMILGLAYRWEGDLLAAIKAYSEAQEVSRKSGDNFASIYAACFKGYALTLRGELQDAYAVFRETLDDAERPTRRGGWKPPALGLLHSFLSGVLLEWNDLDAAIYHARTGLDLSERWGNANAILDGLYFYVNTLLATQDHKRAGEAIQKAREVAAGVTSWARLDGALLAIQLHLAEEDIQRAMQHIEEMSLSAADDICFQNLQYYLALARVLDARKDFDQAIHLLDTLLEIAHNAGAMGRVIEIHVARSLLSNRQGNKSDAIRSMKQALRLAEPHGFVNTFIREGLPVGELLRTMAVQGLFPEYIGGLLATLEQRNKRHQKSEAPHASSLVEPLSERELQVLRLLVAGLSSNEIATELFIAVSTARTHIKHIYQKLNVHRRLEAIDRARDLKLV